MSRVNDDNPQAWYIGVNKSEPWPEVNHRLEEKPKKKIESTDTSLLVHFVKWLDENGYEITLKTEKK